jgi:hypothetical protein
MSGWTGRIALALCTFLLCIFALVRWAQSCADPGDPFADYSQHPDISFEKFVQGQLGIVQPTFARSYLVVAYRYASSVPLSKDEQQAAIALWENRGIDMANIFTDNSPGSAEAQKNNYYLQDAQDAADGPKDWLDARGQVVSSPAPQITELQGLDKYNNYLNCSNNAFVIATATLALRVQQFGKDNPGVKEWVGAQDAVFANCGGDPDKPVLPAAPAPSLQEILRYDREYQVAAAYMYSNRYDEAIQGFQSIAGEKNSPWHDIAPYLVARTMVRRATLDVPRPEAPKNGYAPIPAFAPEKMQAAADFTSKALADAPNGPFVTQLQALLDRAQFRLQPAEQTVLLAQRLSKPAPEGRFYDWLWDYTWLLDRRGDARGEYGRGASPEEYAKHLPYLQKDNLTDWIITFQMQSPAATEHAVQVWRANRGSQTWLLSVLSKTEANAPQVSEVLSAADVVPVSSPAYVSVFYHRMRLRNGLGKFPEVRAALDAFLASSPDLPPVAKDYLLNLRLDAASDLNDAVRFLPRENCSVDNRQPPPNCPSTMAEHSALYLDSLPLDVLMDALHNNNLADAEKTKFVRNVWLRAVILGRHDVAQTLDAQAFRAGGYQMPFGNDVIQKLVQDYESASTPEEKQFAAIFLMQHQYAFGYDIGSVDGWCASYAAFPDDHTYWRGTQQPLRPPNPPLFLTEAQRQQAEAEQSTLERTDSQANYYTKVVLEFAEKHPDDPRVPEALSRAVKNTRMNCNNTRTGTLSEAAYNLLHKRYPSTTWAKNTKYWFGEGY